jgi:acetyl-CoA acyltransferase
VIELHDCFSANELITYEAMGLCEEGQGGKLIDPTRPPTAARSSSTPRAG